MFNSREEYERPAGGLPIRSRCLRVAGLIAVAAAMCVQPTAAAQSLYPLTLSASPPAASAVPGGEAIVAVTVHNSGLVAQTARLVGSDLPAGWTYNFTPDLVTVDAGGNATASLSIFAPRDATPGTLLPLAFKARGESGAFNLSDALTVNLTVAAPPAPEAPSAPRITLSIDPSAGPSGGAAFGTLRLVSDETSDQRVAIAIEGPTAWSPRLDFEDRARTLHPHIAATVTPRVSVPVGAPNGTVASFKLIVSLPDFPAYEAVWTVTALPPVATTTSATPDITTATPSEGESVEPASAEDVAPTSDSTLSAPLEPYAFSALVLEATIEIAPGETAQGTLRLRNTGAQPLHVQLSGDAADRWPVAFDVPQFDLAPGVTRDAPFRLTAPAGLQPGGTGQGTLTIATDQGLLRSVPFSLHIVPSLTPRDESAPATETAATAPAGGAGIGKTTALAIGGLAAVGAGALALANRPLREKALWVGVGLYTRLARPDVLGHPERDRLYKLVEAQPGIHFHALQRDLSWNTGTLTYHLRVLERHGFLVSRRDGPYRRFYLAGSAPRKEAFNPGAPHGLRADVLEAVRSHHGISQTDLALALGANKQTVNYHVKALERAGMIRIDKRGRETFLYPSSAPAAGSEAAA